MFIGHVGAAFAGKRFAPKTSLGTLAFATGFLDLIWPVFLILGIEHVRIAPGITRVTPFDFYDYPYSHGLLPVVGWSIVVGLSYFAVRRYRTGAWIVGLGVLSHWFLDWVMHRPDLALWPGGSATMGLASGTACLSRSSWKAPSLRLHCGFTCVPPVPPIALVSGRCSRWLFF